MVNVEKTKRWCNSCEAKENVNEIKVSLDGSHSISLTLCHDCMNELIDKYHKLNK